MKKILFAGVALLAAVPVFAQPAPEGRGPMAGPQTRDAVQARVEARFARADADRDGFVTQDEIRARAEAARGERRGRMFDRLDSNHDGSISRAEFDARPAFRREGGERGEDRAMRGPRDGGRFAHRGPRRGMMGMGGRGFAAMDLDHDGRIARAEADRAALERFDRIDTNRDGTISLDERQAAREAFRDRMEERRGQ